MNPPSRPDLSWECRVGRRVAGLDEVGRGPLAGPVVAACVVLPPDLPQALARLLDDSKRLSAVARQRAYAALRASSAEIAIGAASVDEILRLNILQASLLAMRRAFARLRLPADVALVDGNKQPGLPCETHCLIGGDAISLSIAAASIIAKITRDRAMARLDARHPGYGWASNAGYGTRVHLEALTILGVTSHHRRGFAPVRAIAGRAVEMR